MKLRQPGYAQTELKAAEEKWGFTFPSDYNQFLLMYRPEGLGVIDWVRTEEENIREALDWPLNSILFDVKNGFWIKTWPQKPGTIDERMELAKRLIVNAPKLIPISGHRYIPDEPSLAGNPILSVYQLDIIIYGNNLFEYFKRDHQTEIENVFDVKTSENIPFWSDILDCENHDGDDYYSSQEFQDALDQMKNSLSKPS